MGKGFNNYMSKKDFHPSAIWNLKRVFNAEQKLAMEKKKQDELRTQYEKEQEIVNNKALLGDEKAKLGLAFMYDAPAGIRKEEKTLDPASEPKFEWQRKYNAPREDWAKGNEDVQDQPFGIQVRNVRCVKCHTWGHVNTDRDCPLYNMSGSKDDPGYSTNPSDLIRQMRKSKGESTSSSGQEKKEHMDPRELVSDMRTEYGLTLKKHVLDQVREDDALKNLAGYETSTLKKPKKEEDTSPQRPPAPRKSSLASNGGNESQQLMFTYLKSLSDKERAKIFKKFMEKEAAGNDYSSSSSEDDREERRRKRKSSSSKSSSKKHRSEGRSKKSRKEESRRHRRH